MNKEDHTMNDATEGAARVRLLARCARLPLPADREAAVATILDAWLPDANALSEKMSMPAHRDLVPATVFTHPGAVGDTER